MCVYLKMFSGQGQGQGAGQEDKNTMGSPTLALIGYDGRTLSSQYCTGRECMCRCHLWCVGRELKKGSWVGGWMMCVYI